MDRYDAILEQTRRAQRHGFDSLASHLENVIVALERSFESAKSSLQNALPSDPEAMFPIAEVESQVAAIRDLPQKTATVTLADLRTLDQTRTQSELLRALLPLLGEHVGRALVLVIRDGIVTAWSGVGFTDPDRVRGWQGGIAASPDLTRLVETITPRHFSPAGDPLFSKWLASEGAADEAVLLPISLRGKLMGMVYADRVAGGPWNLDAAQALTAIACLLIDTLKQRPEAQSPMLAEIVAAEPPPAAEAEPEIFAAPPEPEDVAAESAETSFGFEAEGDKTPPSAESFDSAAAEAVRFEAPTDWQQPAPGDDVEIEYDFEPEPAAAEPEPVGEAFDPTATMRVEVDEEGPAMDAGSQPQFAGAPPPSVGEADAPPPVRPIEPPQPQAAHPVDGSLEDDARHEEARRFARLLVSEIKLYNEEAVERGRVERDLAQRLKEDIDRSREMYEKRIPPEVRAGRDYFRDELVRILADGDSDALGM